MAVAAPAAAQQAASGTVRGTVVDGGSLAPLGAVQVTVRSATDTTRAVGTLTGSNGRFVVPGLAAGSYEVRFDRLGYARVSRSVTIDPAVGGSGDLGTVPLTEAAVELEAVNVVAERPAVVHAADRDVYAAESVAGAEGGSATDVLQGIPDLEVDINGSVTMHGEAPAIYINGRETPMTGEALALFLEQFAAENIDRVEVIPNPSARYDAEGAGGVVNIVLKENVGLGISGNAFVNGGTGGRFRGGGRATYQRGPLTLNGGGSIGTSSDERSSSQLRQNLLTDPVTFLEQAGTSDRSSWSGNVDLEAAYEISSATRLNAETRVSRNVSTLERLTRYTEMDADRNVTEMYDLSLLDDGAGGSIDLALELEHALGGSARSGNDEPRQFGRERDELSVELEYERGRDLEEGLVERRFLDVVGEEDPATELTREEDRETESELAIGFDYGRGFGESTRVEFGYEGEFGWTDEGRIQELRLDDPSTDPVRSTIGGFVHRQNVHGGYLTLTRSFGELGAQLGLRAEHASSRLELPGDGGTHGQDDLSVYPSANLNYSFGGGRRIRLSYSVRVRRPSSNVLNPIDTSSDPSERRVGNPSIEPQYTHSYMLNASWSGERGYLRATPFFRRSLNEWEQLRTVDADGIATTTYENLGSTDSYGVSLTAGVRDFHGIGGRVSLSGRHTDRDYAAILERATPSTTRWSVRAHLDGELTSGLSAQGFVVYNPPRDLPQGRASATVMTRAGLRYRFLERRASLNVGVTDPFDIYDSSIERSSAGYVESGRERVSMRRVSISLSYSFQGGARTRGGPRGGWRGR